MSTRKGKSVTSILFAGNFSKAVFIFLLLLAVITAAASAECEWNVTLEDEYCQGTAIEGWFYNTTTSKSVPYNIGITPSSGSFPEGTPIELEATVDYCAGEGGGNVTAVFETDNGNINITDVVNFGLETRKVPALSLPFIIFLAVMLSVIAISAIRRSKF